MSKYLLIALSYLLSTINGAPCIPANTCFPYAMRPTAAAISSIKFTCSSGKVTQNLYFGSSDCSGSPQSVNELGNYDLASMNVLADGSGSGTLTTNLIQGTDCPVLTSASDTCDEFMIIRKYGNKGYSYDGEDLPYQNLGDNCASRDASYYDQYVVPIGCGDIYVGRNDYGCNSTHWWYDHFNTRCAAGGGTYESAQSDWWKVDECAVFSERTHCGGSSSGQTICATGGVLVEYPYWIDLECCGDCTIQQGSQPTATPAPTTGNPTDANGTGKPTTPNPTAPTIGGTDSTKGSGANELKCIVTIFVVMIMGLF
mmetsp:Transcript_56517/g.50855  ORF Transcript_56517/g.50855 Transcript_56517/m.50855 type:complete len:313 (+) Transcript_56517:76-1014(+)|eukprot:CAMPEP_0201573274 /NCGR_PEP_ID=MMETSP0190_2-20130828/17017_1 /ASSEMBLY_ACC=CAM_ASM_000263 /TAXON_ID=37353 /ORGANISM="Rosalina sp." /LENGTH=312 /DNA_ID=CAMNT_0048000019 /DNA_START=66 /DNA_END=1004 /DNA_ORIENTATION=+